MNLTKKSIFLVLVMITLLCGCPKKMVSVKDNSLTSFRLNAEQGVPVIQVGPKIITDKAIRRQLIKQSAFMQQKFQTDDAENKKFLEIQVRKELLYLAALRKGYLNDPQIQETIKNMLIQKLTQGDFLQSKRQSSFSKTELKAYYVKNLDRFRTPKKLSLLHVFIPAGKNIKISSQKAAAAYQKLAKVTKNRVQVLGKLALEMSDATRFAPNTGSLGALGYKSHKELKQIFGENIADNAFKLTANNELTPVVKSKDGHFIFLKIGESKASIRSFEQAKSSISRKLFYENKRQAFLRYIEKLKDDFGVKIYPKCFSKLKNSAG